MWVHCCGPGKAGRATETRVRAKLASVTNASKPWPL